MSASFAGAWPVYAFVFAGLLLASSGIGACALGTTRPNAVCRMRQVVAEHVLGLLCWTALIGVCCELNLSVFTAGVVLGAFLAAGLAVIAFVSVGHPRHLVSRLAVTAGLGAAALLLGLTPVNDGAADGLHYAYIAATLFRVDWIQANLLGAQDAAYFADLTRQGMLTRGPEAGLLWPATLLGLGVDARSIAALGAWLTVATFGLLFDVFRTTQTRLIGSVVLAIGAIGAFNVTALLSGGQINQVFALAAVIAGVWLMLHVQSARRRWFAAAVVGGVIGASYPEFLVVLPLYALAQLLVRPTRPREMGLTMLCVASGVVLMLLPVGRDEVRYLIGQRDQAPGWWPLPADPRSPLDSWSAIVAQTLPPLRGLVLLVPLVLYGAWAATRVCPSRLPRWAIQGCAVALIGLMAVWTWLASAAPNTNYATFKIGGWIGPGLVLVAWMLCLSAPTRLRTLAAAGILITCAVRSVGLVFVTANSWSTYTDANTGIGSWQLQSSVDQCVVSVAGNDQRAILAAIAGSAAPGNGCRVSYV